MNLQPWWHVTPYVPVNNTTESVALFLIRPIPSCLICEGADSWSGYFPPPSGPLPPHSSALLPLWVGLSLDVLIELMYVVLTKRWEGHCHPTSSPCPPRPHHRYHQSIFCPFHRNLDPFLFFNFKEDHFGLAQHLYDTFCWRWSNYLNSSLPCQTMTLWSTTETEVSRLNQQAGAENDASVNDG